MSAFLIDQYFNIWLDRRKLNVHVSASNLLRYLVFVDAYDENPVSHIYIVTKGRSAKVVFLARD